MLRQGVWTAFQEVIQIQILLLLATVVRLDLSPIYLPQQAAICVMLAHFLTNLGLRSVGFVWLENSPRLIVRPARSAMKGHTQP